MPRILAIDDSPIIHKIITTVLAPLGYEVVTAANGEEGLALVHSARPDLVITDVIMPEMNGRDLSDQLHALYPEIKSLFMSGYTADVIAHRGILDEGVHFIHKPFSIKDLAVKVREALNPRIP